MKIDLSFCFKSSNATTFFPARFEALNLNSTLTEPLTVFSSSFAAGVVNSTVFVTLFPSASTIYIAG